MGDEEVSGVSEAVRDSAPDQEVLLASVLLAGVGSQAPETKDGGSMNDLFLNMIILTLFETAAVVGVCFLVARTWAGWETRFSGKNRPALSGSAQGLRGLTEQPR